MTDQNLTLEALYAAQTALGEYACHIGDKHPCRRSKEECRSGCGRMAGDAALLVDAAVYAILHPPIPIPEGE